MKKTKYILNVPLEHGEVSVVLASNAEDMLRHSAKFATDCSALGAGVMLINCGLSERRFNEHTEHIKKYKDIDYMPKKEKPRLMAYNSTLGDLVGDSGTIKAMCMQAHVSVVIIMGWEWTSCTYARKERLLYFMRELLRHGTAVIVYSQATTNPTPGKQDRAGLGKLAMLAYGIVNVEGSEEAAKIAPSPTPVTATDKEMTKMDEKIQLVMNNINELPGKREENSGQSSVVSGQLREKETAQAQPYPLNDDDDWTDDEMVCSS
jgi:hypothetical protein